MPSPYTVAPSVQSKSALPPPKRMHLRCSPNLLFLRRFPSRKKVAPAVQSKSALPPPISLRNGEGLIFVGVLLAAYESAQADFVLLLLRF
jgi:hypothetical protein